MFYGKNALIKKVLKRVDFVLKNKRVYVWKELPLSLRQGYSLQTIDSQF
jgi:hypothetical protein